MAKNASESQTVGESPTEFQVTLEEFCTRISKTDRRVELIGAFHHVEKAAGRVKDAESAFAARFADFANQPV